MSREASSRHDAPCATRPSVVIVGGGLAGIAAAVRLASRGVRTTLVETRNRLGGRATSFTDPKTGQVLDNCQHVLMGCCTNLVDLYRRLGVADRIRWHRRLYFGDGRGGVDQLEADDLPAPVHMTRSLMGFRLLTLVEKLAIARGMLAILRMGQTGRQRWHNARFSQWLDDHRQPASVVRKFWSVIVTSALNERIDRVDAAYAIQVFQEGFLANEQAYVMGLPAVPLANLYDTAPRVLADAGGTVCLSTRAQELVFDGRRVTALRLGDGRQLAADAFIAATPYDRLARLCTAPMCQFDSRVRAPRHFGASPIIGIHLWFETRADQPLMSWPHLILTDGMLHWVFNKGHDGQRGGQHLHAVISAAYDLVDAPAESIIDRAVAQIRRAVQGSSAAARAPLLDGRVIKEKRATFSAEPGVDPIRPATRGPIANLYVAGDWCRTGWPATMEGAVRSGYLAAAAVAEDFELYGGPEAGQRGPSLVADLPAHALYEMCSVGP